MRNIEIGGYIRISKKEAEKRYNAGEIIRLCACKVSPVNVWGVYVDCQKAVSYTHLTLPTNSRV